MPDSGERFVVRFPCITLPNGERGLVIFSARPNTQSAAVDLVLATCLTVKGRLVPNIPISMQALTYASRVNGVTLREGEGSGDAVFAGGSGLVGPNGGKL